LHGGTLAIVASIRKSKPNNELKQCASSQHVYWFSNVTVRFDLGFFGFEKDYKCKEAFLPHKKPKKQELTPEQKAENKALASKRIVVEHSIAGLKRYRILSDRLRMHDLDLYNQVLGVCAGLWNFRLSC
jgi:hypothetical protein